MENPFKWVKTHLELLLARVLFKVSKIRAIGVTGTNGKGTTGIIIKSILGNSGRKVAFLGTPFYDLGEGKIESKATSPAKHKLAPLLYRAEKNGCNLIVMEIASESIREGWNDKAKFKTKVFTNFSREHLEYHKTLEGYLKTKIAFFKKGDKDCKAILNNDDEKSELIKKHSPLSTITFGIKNKSDIMAENIKYSWTGTEFKLKINGKKTLIKTPIIGEFNVYNILAAVAACTQYNIALDTIKKTLETIEQIPGRFEIIQQSPFKIIIDYAHNDGGLIKIFKIVKKFKHTKIIAVIGCQGNKKYQRKGTGKIVSRYADYAFLTSDNPQNENPLSIINEIKQGFSKKFKKYSLEPNRYQATKKAINMAKKGDVILILGKGDETDIKIKDKKVPYNDKEVVLKLLK